MTLEQVEQKIYDYYQGMHTEAIKMLGVPGAYDVKVQEVGVLAQYWALFDSMVEEER